MMNLFIVDLPSLARLTGLFRWYDRTEMPVRATAGGHQASSQLLLATT